MEVSLTTNGTFLRGRAEDLKTAGLARVNISQDALDPEQQFAAVTKSGTYETVLDGVDSALEAGLAPVKLNMVVFEQTAGYVEGMVEHVADQEGLQLQLHRVYARVGWSTGVEHRHRPRPRLAR